MISSNKNKHITQTVHLLCKVSLANDIQRKQLKSHTLSLWTRKYLHTPCYWKYSLHFNRMWVSREANNLLIAVICAFERNAGTNQFILIMVDLLANFETWLQIWYEQWVVADLNKLFTFNDLHNELCQIGWLAATTIETRLSVVYFTNIIAYIGRFNRMNNALRKNIAIYCENSSHLQSGCMRNGSFLLLSLGDLRISPQFVISDECICNRIDKVIKEAVHSIKK